MNETWLADFQAMLARGVVEIGADRFGAFKSMKKKLQFPYFRLSTSPFPQPGTNFSSLGLFKSCVCEQTADCWAGGVRNSPSRGKEVFEHRWGDAPRRAGAEEIQDLAREQSAKSPCTSLSQQSAASPPARPPPAARRPAAARKKAERRLATTRRLDD